MLTSLLVALSSGTSTPAIAALPPVKHVFVIVLENKDAQKTFGANAAQAPYINGQLRMQGQYVPNYFGTTHLSLGNYIAMVSGQGSNPGTQADCLFFMDVVPGTIGADGQATGLGCVYPKAVQTVADQLDAKGLSWRGYMEDMANSTTQSRTCRHPALNSPDSTQSAKPGDQYATRHNPFVYFHSIIDRPGCDANDVDLRRLDGDLASADSTPNLVFITPNLCHDGHDTPCVDGQPGGLVSADRFVAQWAPKIIGSPAYADGGLLVVTWDESESGAEGCCGELSANTPNAGGTSFGPGGGRPGAVLLSPYIVGGQTNSTNYNHYGLLRSIEDIFGLGHLGYAARPGLRSFGEDVFTRPGGLPPAPPPPCTSAALPKGAKGTLKRGALIASATVRARRLRVRLTHAADLSIVASGRRVGPRRGKACRTVSVTLPRGARSVRVKASVKGARETRTVRVR